jgi:hypothetical protein
VESEHRAGCNIEGNAYPRPTQRLAVHLVDHHDIDESVVNLNDL